MDIAVSVDQTSTGVDHDDDDRVPDSHIPASGTVDEPCQTGSNNQGHCIIRFCIFLGLQIDRS